MIAAACCLDAIIGDPAWLPHPVRLMGAAITAGERLLNREGRGSHTAGAALSLSVACCAAAVGIAARRSPAMNIVLAATTIAARDLLAEAGAVAKALEAGDLALARRRVGRIVGRDTGALDAAEVARAAIETLAESACDGIVAPLFWLTLSGLPGALAFKAASTLDSMIGHRDSRYVRFGAFAARLDDVLNFVPARLTALIIAGLGGAPLRSAQAALRDAPRHASPNAGWPEAALAGALGVRLGGLNSYGGIALEGPTLNSPGRSPGHSDVRKAMRIIRGVTWVAAACAVGARA